MLAETLLGGCAAGTDQVDVTLHGQAHMEQMITGIRSIEEGIAATYGMPKDQTPTMVGVCKE